MTKLLTMVPIVYAIVAFALLCYFFSDASEKKIMKYARAAKKFQIYGGDSQAASLLLAARLRVQEQVTAAIRALRAKLASRRRCAWLFQIAPVPLVQPGFRAEKLKILLGFFQIFGGFKRNYEIPWPDEMSRLMDVYSIADFNFIDTTSIECYYKRDYFASYRYGGVDGCRFCTELTLAIVAAGIQAVSLRRADPAVDHGNVVGLGQRPLSRDSLDASSPLCSLWVACVSNAATLAPDAREARNNGIDAQDRAQESAKRAQGERDAWCMHEGELVLSRRGRVRSGTLVGGKNTRWTSRESRNG